VEILGNDALRSGEDGTHGSFAIRGIDCDKRRKEELRGGLKIVRSRKLQALRCAFNEFGLRQCRHNPPCRFLSPRSHTLLACVARGFEHVIAVAAAVRVNQHLREILLRTHREGFGHSCERNSALSRPDHTTRDNMWVH
jgi:hypothetical protein